MSNEIDWSKAPEGATHYNSELPFPWLLDGDMPAYFVDGKWIVYESKSSGCARIKESVRIPANVEWDGVGLPPVGTVCEAWHIGSKQGKVKVLYSGEFMVLWNIQGQHEQAGRFGDYEFRPIRTPEQIAAEAREKAIREMRHIAEHDAHCRTVDYGALYDAGYRRVEVK